MPDWLVLWVYLIGWAFASVPTAVALVKDLADGDFPSTFDYIAGSALGFLAASFWPLYIPVWFIYIQVRKSLEKGKA